VERQSRQLIVLRKVATVCTSKKVLTIGGSAAHMPVLTGLIIKYFDWDKRTPRDDWQLVLLKFISYKKDQRKLK